MLRFLLASLLLVATAAIARPAMPSTPAGRVFAAWLDAFNAGDEASMTAFDATYAPRGPSMLMAARMRQEIGGLVLVRFERSEPLALVAHLKEKNSDVMRRFELSVVDGDVPRVRLALLQKLPEPMPEADAVAALGEAVDAAIAEDSFSGVVLVERDGEVILAKTGGLADRARTIPVSRDTRFRIGSMNKMFTAIAVLQLVDAGKLSLDDPIARYLPDYPNRELAQKVTIRHLLTHTGGTGDIFGPDFDEHRLELREHADYVRLYGKRALEFAPGSRQAYSNYGFVLLGALIEQVSGASYYDYVQGHVFEPAGMRATGSLPEATPVPNRAVGYMKAPGGWVPNDATLPVRGTAAGGGYTTADDLLRFAHALRAGKLVEAATLAEATRPQEQGYGYGFSVGTSGDAKFYGHNGGAPGMNGELRVVPDLGYVIVSLGNLDPPSADRFVSFFTLRMPRR